MPIEFLYFMLIHFCYELQTFHHFMHLVFQIFLLDEWYNKILTFGESVGVHIHIGKYKYKYKHTSPNYDMCIYFSFIGGVQWKIAFIDHVDRHREQNKQQNNSENRQKSKQNH